ncbi:dTMP kinase [Geoglobus ahangari]|uniref:Probable thymidylate kinase n=1 Tax=Geoglobus ahangari TaxID=113653 RepID=A0A0F7IGU2_9EURY|nr:dTMP kinase [Geoglobus ahangari]AKG91163.1 dTMP kinase [Geoglobus ahangari]
MGFLIAVEGIDGAGKTTIASYLKSVLEDFGFRAEVLKEPSDSEYGRMIKEAKERFPPEKELELFMLDRMVDVRENILPRVNSSVTVIMDRYYYSNVAYQGALGIDPNEILRRNEEIAPKPDLTILLDVSPEVALERVRNRGTTTPFERREYLERVREVFLSIDSDEIRVVDAEQPLEKVKEECYFLVLELLSSRGSFFEAGLRRF